MVSPVSRFACGAVISAGFALAMPVLAQEEVLTAPGDPMTVSGGFGLTHLKANEFVYSGGAVLSQLIWETSYLPVFSLSTDVPLQDGWSISASGAAGFGGDSHMTDYDWDPAFAPGGPDGWSDRSLHPDTHIDHYFTGEIAVKRRMVTTESGTVSLKGGFKYNDVQWSAYGGSFIYSNAALRDTVGTFFDGDPAATYRQMFPIAFAGAEAETEFGQWTLSGGAQAGVTFLARTEDDHWMRDLRFVDTLWPAPVLSARGQLDYHFSDSASFFVAAEAEQIFSQNADHEEIDTTTDTSSVFPGAGAADFASVSVSAGLKGSF